MLDGRVIDRTIILPTNNPYYTDRVIYPLKNNSVIDFCVSYSGAKPIPVEGFKHEVYLGYNPGSPLQPAFKKYLDNTLSLFGLESFLWIRPPFSQKGGSRVVKVEDYETEARKYIDNFVKYIKYMQDGSTVIRASYTEDVNDYLLLNDLFNPKSNETFRINQVVYPKMPIYKIAGIKNLYRNLTEKDKQEMGWNAQYENIFNDKLKKLM